MSIKTNRPTLIAVLFLIFVGVHVSHAQETPNAANTLSEPATESTVQQTIDDELRRRMKITGKLDLFDEKADRVRNLSLINFDEGLNQKEGNYIKSAKFRDFRTGDIVKLDIIVAIEDSQRRVQDFIIAEVIPALKEETAAAAEQFSDQAVQDFIRQYLDRQAKVTGYFNAFNEKTSALLKLKPGSFDGEIRRFGIKFIARLFCEDVDTQKRVPVDITVENLNGQLELKSIRPVE